MRITSAPRFTPIDWTLCAVIIAASLWLRTGFPIHVISNASFDDRLFIRAARYLGAGEWLGPYNNLTLAKGMFYPLFILGAFLLAIPLIIAEQAAWLGASALAARLVFRASGSRWLTLTLFAILAFNPVLWNPEMNRVIREGLYISLSLGVVVMAVGVCFPSEPAFSKRALARGVGLGAVLGAFWLTREEGPWLLPAIAATVLVSVLMIGRRGAWLGSVGVPLVVAGAIFAASVGAVAAMNYHEYGVFITNEFRSTPFLRAYGALARITPDHWRRFVVFPKDARVRAYAVSPAAAELAPVLDGPQGAGWAKNGCVLSQAAACPEIPSGVFMWAFREAVATAGHYTSAPEAMRYYNRLADQINTACAARTLPCGPPRATQMPVFRRRYIGETARDALVIAPIMLSLGGEQIASLPSVGPPSGVAIFADLTGDIVPVHQAEENLIGSASSPVAPPTVSVRDAADQQVDTTLSQTRITDDVGLAPAGWAATLFDLRTNCPASCSLIVSAPGQKEVSIPLRRSLAAGQVVNTPGLRVRFDFAEFRDIMQASARRRAVQLRIARAIGFVYARAVPPLAALAVVGLIAAIARRRAPPALIALAVASAVAFATRLALLAYLDVTSILAANVLYASPAMPFVIVFTVIGCWCLLRASTNPRHAQIEQPFHLLPPAGHRTEDQATE